MSEIRHYHVSETRRYRKVGTILARQIPPGATVEVETLEGPATGQWPDWEAQANTERGEKWVISAAYFAGPNGYKLVGELVNGVGVYRKKSTADVLAYKVDVDDHEPVSMYGLNSPFTPVKDKYYVVTQLDGSERRAVVADEFEGDSPSYEPV